MPCPYGADGLGGGLGDLNGAAGGGAAGVGADLIGEGRVVDVGGAHDSGNGVVDDDGTDSAGFGGGASGHRGGGDCAAGYVEAHDATHGEAAGAGGGSGEGE